MKVSEIVARALAKVSKVAGRSTDQYGNMLEKEESIEKRAQNLLRVKKYGAYIVDGDPNQWGGRGAVATIYMEEHGGEGDCVIPLSYYGENGEEPFDVASRASLEMKQYWIEFVNAAVACVYRN